MQWKEVKEVFNHGPVLRSSANGDHWQRVATAEGGWTRMGTDQNRNSPARIGSPKSEFLEQRENSLFVPSHPCESVSIRVSYCIVPAMMPSKPRTTRKMPKKKRNCGRPKPVNPELVVLNL
jgi:hypothetical protein